MSELVPVERIERKIHLIRGQKVMLDRDLAELYGVKAIALRQQVKRNAHRFPEDFVFQLAKSEAEALVSQSVIPSKRSFGGFLPFVFLEPGVAMLSSVLRSQRAIMVNVQIMRAFIQLRNSQESQRHLLERLNRHEVKLLKHDRQIDEVFQVLDDLRPEPEASKKRKIGFTAGT